jgi:HSP20 family protein
MRITMIEIDEAIGRVENLYRAVTGKDMPRSEAAYAPIPTETDPVSHVQEQIDRLLSALGTSAEGTQLPTPSFTPPMSVWDSEHELLLSIDVPGAPRDRLEVTVEAGALLIVGQRAELVTNGFHRLRMTERPVGLFRRIVPLPPGLRTADMSAQLRDGVLEVRIPHEGTEPARPVPIA